MTFVWPFCRQGWWLRGHESLDGGWGGVGWWLWPLYLVSSPVMVALAPKCVRLAPNGTKPGLFQIRGAKCTEIWSEKAPDLSHLGPIWPTLEPNLPSLVWLEWFKRLFMSCSCLDKSVCFPSLIGKFLFFPVISWVMWKKSYMQVLQLSTEIYATIIPTVYFKKIFVFALWVVYVSRLCTKCT